MWCVTLDAEQDATNKKIRGGGTTGTGGRESEPPAGAEKAA